MLTNLGLLLGLIGTLLIAHSTGRHPNDENYTYLDDDKSKKLYFVYVLNRRHFVIGIILITFSFLIQIDFIQIVINYTLLLFMSMFQQISHYNILLNIIGGIIASCVFFILTNVPTWLQNNKYKKNNGKYIATRKDDERNNVIFKVNLEARGNKFLFNAERCINNNNDKLSGIISMQKRIPNYGRGYYSYANRDGFGFLEIQIQSADCILVHEYYAEANNEIRNSFIWKKKTILVDAVNTFVLKDEGIFDEMHQLLEQYPHNKIILTNANDEQMKKFGLNDMPYDVFTLKHNPEKTDSKYFKTMLNKYDLTADGVVYFEHSPEAVESARSVGITSYHYDPQEKDLDGLKNFLDNNL